MQEQKQIIDDMKKTNEWDMEALAQHYLTEINSSPSQTGKLSSNMARIGSPNRRVMPGYGSPPKGSPLRGSPGRSSPGRGATNAYKR